MCLGQKGICALFNIAYKGTLRKLEKISIVFFHISRETEQALKAPRVY